MQLLRAKYTIINQEPGLEGIYKAAELPGRICYGSQDKIAPGTAEKFCNGLMKSNHGAPLEHASIYLECPQNIMQKYVNNPYSKTSYHKTGRTIMLSNVDLSYRADETEYYVSTNLRVLFENGWLDDLQYICEPTEYHEQRVMVSFAVDRFTGEEFLRHRKASFNRESTRYVNFSKDKFGGGDVKFIQPVWLNERDYELKMTSEKDLVSMCEAISKGETDMFTDIDYWIFALKSAEYSYNNLIRLGWKPQQARTVLPCAINSPLIKTAFVSDWIHFFNLRAIGTTGAPHPQAKELAEPLMNEFINKGLIKFNTENILVIN